MRPRIAKHPHALLVLACYVAGFGTPSRAQQNTPPESEQYETARAVTVAEVFILFEPFDATRLARLEQAAQSPEYRRQWPQIGLFLYRYGHLKGRVMLVNLLRQHDVMAATVLAERRDAALLPDILQTFLAQRSPGRSLVRAMAKWNHPLVLAALRQVYARDPGNGPVALALARRGDSSMHRVMEKQLRKVGGDGIHNLDILVALGKMNPRQYQPQVRLLVNCVRLRRPWTGKHSVTPQDILGAATLANDQAYRPAVRDLLGQYASGSDGVRQRNSSSVPLNSMMLDCARFLEQSPRPGDVEALSKILPHLWGLKMSMVQGDDADIADIVLRMDPIGGPILLGPNVKATWLLKAMQRQRLNFVPAEYLTPERKLGMLLR